MPAEEAGTDQSDTATDTAADTAADTQPPDTGDHTGPDTAAPGSCATPGTWSFLLESSVAAGEGCGPDGSTAQPPRAHIFEIWASGEGAVEAAFTEPDWMGPLGMETTLEAIGTEADCQLRIQTGYFFELPTGGGLERTSFAYSITIDSHPDQTLSGPASMNMNIVWAAWGSGSPETRVDCSEDLVVVGTWEASD